MYVDKCSLIDYFARSFYKRFFVKWCLLYSGVQKDQT